MISISIADAQKRFEDLVTKVHQGEVVIIVPEDGGSPVRLVAAGRAKKTPVPDDANATT